MQTILQINTSLFSEGGHSSRLADALVQRLRASNPDARLSVRDLTRNALPHLDAERITAFGTPAEKRTSQQQTIVAESDALIAELKSAEVVVLGLPMYNFGVPSQLKAYFDHIARAGVTFRYTTTGPEGMLGDRKVYVLATRGGKHRGTVSDSETGFVTQFLNFVGIRSIEFIYAEGLNMGPDIKDAALSEASATIQQLAA